MCNHRHHTQGHRTSVQQQDHEERHTHRRSERHGILREPSARTSQTARGWVMRYSFSTSHYHSLSLSKAHTALSLSRTSLSDTHTSILWTSIPSSHTRKVDSAFLLPVPWPSHVFANFSDPPSLPLHHRELPRLQNRCWVRARLLH